MTMNVRNWEAYWRRYKNGLHSTISIKMTMKTSSRCATTMMTTTKKRLKYETITTKTKTRTATRMKKNSNDAAVKVDFEEDAADTRTVVVVEDYVPIYTNRGVDRVVDRVFQDRMVYKERTTSTLRLEMETTTEISEIPEYTTVKDYQTTKTIDRN